MRKVSGIIVVVLMMILGAYGACSAVSPFSGSVETALALDFSGASFAIQSDSDTYCKLLLRYTTGGWNFKSQSTFGVSGFITQEFDTSGTLGLIVLNSQLLFSPILGSPPATFTDNKTTSGTEHKYDLGVPYFVDSVTVTSLTIVPSGSIWRITASLDGTTPIWTSQAFTPPAIAPIPVGVVARYITIVAQSGASLTQSAVTMSVSSQSWVTTARTVSDGVTLFGTFTLATGFSSLALGVMGSHADNLPVSGTVYFNLLPPDCSFCFDRFEGSFGLSFGCIKRATATLRIDCAGFDELTFAVIGLDFGLPDITLDVTVSFSLTTKTVTLSPLLTLPSNTCLTVYASLGYGPDGAWEISGLSIYGLRFMYSWDGVSFESLSYVDGLHYVKDTYWEKFTIKSTGDSCCGGKLTFEVSTYFQDLHTTLFDWGETEVDLSFDVGNNMTLSTGLVVNATGLSEGTIGWSSTW